jgi:hypothetical protein
LEVLSAARFVKDGDGQVNVVVAEVDDVRAATERAEGRGPGRYGELGGGWEGEKEEEGKSEGKRREISHPAAARFETTGDAESGECACAGHGRLRDGLKPASCGE